MIATDRFAFPSVITTQGMCTIHACPECGAALVIVPGDGIDRRTQHMEWHREAASEKTEGSGRTAPNGEQ